MRFSICELIEINYINQGYIWHVLKGHGKIHQTNSSAKILEIEFEEFVVVTQQHSVPEYEDECLKVLLKNEIPPPPPPPARTTNVGYREGLLVETSYPPYLGDSSDY